jgi:hypothetical protein
MRVTLFALPLAAAMLLLSIPAEAHHSFSGTYDTSKQVTIKGKIVRVSLRSPHAFFFVESEDSQGTAQEWAIEAASATQFAQQGITRDSFKAGDPVELIANPARSTTLGFRARLLKITRTTDGKSWGGRPGETVQ